MTQFSENYRARWSDMDFNQHMRNAAYLGCAEETRMRYLASCGWTMAEFEKRSLGPVVLDDRLVYKGELALLETFRVDLQVAALTEDGRRMKVRNRFFKASDGSLSAIVESVVLWFDLAQRKPVAPPERLRDAWFELERTEDFAWYDGRRSEASNLELALSYLRAVEAGATGEQLAAFFDPAVVLQEYPNRLVPKGATRDLSATLAAAERGQKVVSNQRYAVRKALADGDTVALEVDWTATLNVQVGSTPPGGTLEAAIGMFLTFREGRIVSQRNYDCYPPF